ncbi:hypothetical protein EDE08_109220 [Bradyrhizobium sp. R2.2-H]|jgi:hypothetical protein|uniref:hypothetical protein n=1 Tax=unclassified Bradyrhizobium TaxID=2631580 RepID=UPI001046CE92|nr:MULTISPECIES: hypothetical protein [unclassified Bradyrhizobium]TCU68379.1 hypothetical protein EDE10_109193 [Bradyrhizobium sp. Y-H1]TCU69999.1 hypothetical protein EDE08_109220 [Bradyrhizobium sp. R2.2-H]
MNSIEITLQALDAAERAIPSGQPIYMLNLLRYRAQARYEDGFDAAPCSGREAFNERYRPAFRRLAAGKPLVRVFSVPVLANIVGAPGERWDEAAINEYGDFATFRSIVENETYRCEVAPHRHAALEEFRLFALAKDM